jgi:endonuclease/exonuclease/phosphatase family metal-dependent hydrolase
LCYRSTVDRLRVLTLNIWNRQGPWERRLALIRRGIEALAPDLIGLQEVLHHDAAPDDQAHEIGAALGYHATFGAAWHIGGGLHFGNAVLSRFPIVARHHWTLPGDPAEETRGLLHADVDAPCGRVPLFVTHLDWRLHHGYHRLGQVEFIADRVQEIMSDGADRFPAILVGDFNAEPGSDEIRFLRGHHTRGERKVYFADCFEWRGGGGPGHTFAGTRNEFAALAHEPDRRLDYVFVRGPDKRLRGEPTACRIVLDEAVDGIHPSDHFGVFAELHAAPRALGV